MNGAQLFLLFLVFAWPVLFAAVMETRRRLKIWLWLEGQWNERKRLLKLGRRSRKAPDERQVLLFPEPTVTDASAGKVKVWR